MDESSIGALPGLRCGLVQFGMAVMAQRNEIFLGVVASMTAKYLVVYFQPVHAAAELASPRVPFEDSESQWLCELGINLRVPAHFAPGSQLRSALSAL